MALPIDVPDSVPSPRGVYRGVAAHGRAELVAVNSKGDVFMRLEMPRDQCDAELVAWLTKKLDEADPRATLHLERTGWSN